MSTEAVAATALRSTVLIRTRFGAGSGFCVAPGAIVTNFHVVAGESWMAVWDYAEVGHVVAGVRIYDEATDLALLHVPSATMPPMRLATAVPAIGAPIVVSSNPLGYQGSITTGVVSGVRPQGIQLDAAIASGSSGAPVLDRTASVIGVIRDTRSDGQNLNFAVPAADVQRLMAYAPSAVLSPVTFAATTRNSRTRTLIECAALIETVARAFYEFGDHVPASQQSNAEVERMRRVAHLYLEIGKRIEGLGLSSMVAKHATEYHSMCLKVANAARALVAAMESQDTSKTEAASIEFRALEREEDTLAHAIGSFCSR